MSPDPFDVCLCGDFRHQHQDGRGRCKMGSLCTPFPCAQFRLLNTAEQYAERYPEHAAMVRGLLETETKCG